MIYDALRYSSELHEYWNEKLKVIEDFSQYLKEKADLDKLYAKGLEKISKLPIFDRFKGPFLSNLSSVQSSMLEISDCFSSHSEYVTNELLVNLKSMQVEYESEMKQLKKKIKKLAMEREKLNKKHQMAREKYIKTPKEKEGKLSSSFIKMLCSETSFLDAYLVALNKLNKYNAVFKEEIVPSLSEFKQKIIESFKFLKVTMQRTLSSDASCIYSMKMHIDNLARSVNTISFESELEALEKLLFKGTDFTDEVFVSRNSNIRKQEIGLELESCIYDEDFRSLLNNCWNGIPLKQEDLQIFTNRISSQEGKKQFILLLNEKRKLGKFLIPDESFQDLGLLFRLVLDSVSIDRNFACVRQCIILSQTFYKKDKEYIQQQILQHFIWKQENYWEELVEESIKKEIEAQEIVIDEFEEKEEIENRVKSVAIATLASYIDIMVSFHKENSEIMTIANNCRNKFLITEEDFPLSYIISITKGH
ncbi:hypothetical protein SteCoe_29653 [Stentor coeruleus]|uniref:SBF1/SBF2 domain-containing protein n=1 Tax=Stentor coeruleus TaxID=5963 RepID=A0A1R2B5H7_9CILI|nr:hypothetical protein SteCoe_29653 [Stentor coeruleus]